MMSLPASFVPKRKMYVIDNSKQRRCYFFNLDVLYIQNVINSYSNNLKKNVLINVVLFYRKNRDEPDIRHRQISGIFISVILSDIIY